METLAIGAANSIYLIAAVMLGCGILLLWGVAFSGFRKTKRTGQVVATVILALATIGLGFLWMLYAIVGVFHAGHHEDFGLPMVVYYSPWFITSLWIVNLIVFLRDMFTRKNREVST
jgi:hypothetical protein